MKDKVRYKKVDQAALHIINELISFSMRNGAEDLNINIQDKPQEVLISVTSQLVGMDDSILDTASRYLKSPRQHEIEGCFGELTGDSIDDTELALVGMMTDNADIKYDGATLSITVVRKK